MRSIATNSCLQEQGGKGLIIYGHGQLGAALLEHGLLDELQFAIHPAFVGEGTPLLRPGATPTLAPSSVRTLGTGVIAPRYRPAGE